jgi:hypothetical protein
MSQLLDEGFEVFFRPGGSRILDSRGGLGCIVVPRGQVFRVDFSQSSGVACSFLAGSSSELRKWHMKLGHLSFDLLSRLTLLDFPPNATHKMCCNMPHLVAIDTIATKLFRGPWDAKGRVALGYCDVVHHVVAKVFLLQRNATLQLGFFTMLVLVAKCTIVTHLGCCQRCNCNVSVSLQIIVLLRTEFGCYRLNLLYYHESNLVAICSIV